MAALFDRQTDGCKRKRSKKSVVLLHFIHKEGEKGLFIKELAACTGYQYMDIATWKHESFPVKKEKRDGASRLIWAK